MKLKNAACLGLFTFPVFTYAGGSVGNGGGAWVCREENDSIRWTKFVDLYEAKTEFGLDIDLENPVPIDQQLDTIRAKVKKVNREFYRAFSKSLERVRLKMKITPDVDLEIIDDSLFRVKPALKTCSKGKLAYEQLANYTAYGQILVNQEIYEKLTLTERAALEAHEAAYKLQRDRNGAKNSVTSRKLVGELFSSLKPSSYSDDLKLGAPDEHSEEVCDICIENLGIGGNFTEGVASFKNEEGNVGFMDHSGKVVIAPQFTDAGEFHEGLAPVQFPSPDGKKVLNSWGYIDHQGETVIPGKYGQGQPYDFAEGVTPVSYHVPPEKAGWPNHGTDFHGLINKLGEVIIPFANHSITPMSEGLIRVNKYWPNYDGCKYYNIRGEVVLSLDYEGCGNFSQGLAPVKKGEKYGYIDHQGQVIIPFQFENADIFNSDRAPVQIGELWGYIDRSGGVVIPPQFQYAWVFQGELGVVVVGKDQYQRSLWRIIDRGGRFITEERFHGVNSWAHRKPGVSYDLIPVELDNKWGYIDRSGNRVIEPQFGRADLFYEGVASTDRGYISLDKL